MLLCRVWPQHADDDVARVASDEGLARHGPREDIGVRRLAEGTADDGLHRPSVDAAERAEAQGSPGRRRLVVRGRDLSEMQPFGQGLVVLPVRVLTKIRMPSLRHNTRWRVLSFWML
jgi:hypothetical protein